jgi:hypothetical protein
MEHDRDVFRDAGFWVCLTLIGVIGGGILTFWWWTLAG